MNSYTLHQFLHLARRHLLHFDTVKIREPITVAARSEAWVCSRSLAGIVGSNPSGACVYFVLSGRGLFVGPREIPGSVRERAYLALPHIRWETHGDIHRNGAGGLYQSAV